MLGVVACLTCVVCCSVCVVCCLLFVVCCVVRVVSCSLFVVGCLLRVVCRLLIGDRRAPLVVWCVFGLSLFVGFLFVVCCLRFGVRCVRFVV